VATFILRGKSIQVRPDLGRFLPPRDVFVKRVKVLLFLTTLAFRLCAKPGLFLPSLVLCLPRLLACFLLGPLPGPSRDRILKLAHKDINLFSHANESLVLSTSVFQEYEV
jgi:hypothetical protein